MGEAVSYLQQVLPTAREWGDDELLAVPSSIIGRVMFFQGYVGQARQPLEGAAPLLEKVGNWTEWISTVGFLGIVLAAGREHLEKAAAQFEASGLMAEAQRTHALLHGLR
jgi:hypothetical protein